QVVGAYCDNPARHFSLTRKGKLATGMDADVVLVDPHQTWTVTESDIRSKAAWTPFLGRELQGRVITTFLRGKAIFHDGSVVGDATGRFVSGPGADRESAL